jgi:predicted phage tail protein
MTNVYLHGQLAQIFGKFFKLKINNAFSALKGIDSNRNGFLKKISSLSQDGIHYCMIVNGEKIEDKNQLIEKKIITSIHIIPVICGSGELVAVGLGLVAAGQLTAIGSIIAGLVNLGISLGVQFLVNSLMGKNQSSYVQKNISVGGASAAIEAAGKSYIFSNNVNTSDQGSSIPIGYGKMKASSSVIFSSVLNYNTNVTYKDEFMRGESILLFSDFLAN